jgi:Flp pilus assembly protein TadG
VVLPVFMALLGGTVQFGLILWGQNTLTQIVRDTGRWEAAELSCSNTAAVIATANTVAAKSSLIGYTPGSWTGAQVTVTWSGITGSNPCPPTSIIDSSGNPIPPIYATITITTTVPVFFPVVPGIGHISSTAQYQIEPAPQ